MATKGMFMRSFNNTEGTESETAVRVRAAASFRKYRGPHRSPVRFVESSEAPCLPRLNSAVYHSLVRGAFHLRQHTQRRERPAMDSLSLGTHTHTHTHTQCFTSWSPARVSSPAPHCCWLSLIDEPNPIHCTKVQSWPVAASFTLCCIPHCNHP